MLPVCVKLDALNVRLRQLIPFAADRIEAYARAHQPEVDPSEFAAGIIARVWANDGRLLLIGIVNPETAELVGHVIAEHRFLGTEHWIAVEQAEADGKAKEARFSAVDLVRIWATSLGIGKILVSANGDGKQWEKKRGAKFYRHVLMLPLEHTDARDPAEPRG